MTTSATTWTRFPKAPIKEAILDIRTELPADIGLPQLSAFEDVVRDRYPQKRERVQWRAEVAIRAGVFQPPASRGAVDGYLYTSADGKDVVQARLDGFTLNRIQPYDRWETFRDEGKRLWQHYLRIAKPKAVTRLALRYINRLLLPLPFSDFKEYILTTPEIAPSLPQGLKSFFMRLEIPNATYNAIAVITETMEQPDENHLPVIFDIDVIREVRFEPSAIEIWNTFETLRDYKNEVFFKSVTDKAKELFR